MAAHQTRLEYESLPAVMPSYVRAATTLSGSLSRGETIPDIVAELPDLAVRADALAQYRKVCGFSHSRHLPVTYPHVLAFPMHMAVLTHKRFPLKLLGLIHVRNEITQHRAIATDEKLHIEVRVDGHRDVAKGVEFDLVTRVRDRAGELVWEETGAMLSRQKSHDRGGRDQPRSKPPEPPASPDVSEDWEVPADIGRRYARAAGDYNPIHLSAYSAKLFGFPRAIATGMWTKARAAATLEPRLSGEAFTLGVAFKKPVFLPSRVRLGYNLTEQGAEFALTDSKGDIVHLLGDVRYR
ncbi:MaoC/PaaZ C-terminal domain-containing protein [Salinisphaera sp. T31B1]|uniref:MaoC family dehydratase n=1 Tax=Salinisphaera sp. T31B1 TaxID=727963 RepID=UPI00333E39ED